MKTAMTVFKRKTALLLGLVLVPAAAIAAEIESTAAERSALTLTVYESDLAVVSERRSIRLPGGVNTLALGDVAAQLMPQTVSLSGNGVKLRESRLAYDLLTPENLLERMVGEQVTLVRVHPATGEERTQKAKLLSAAGGVPVFRVNDRIETGGPNSPWRVTFDSLPPNLRERPTLLAEIESNGGSQPLDLAYLTTGLAWTADYVARLDDANSRLHLTAWASLTNNSGTDYRDARLRLISGSPNRVSARPDYKVMRNMAMAETSAAADGVAQSESFEYYAYDFGRRVNLEDRETKQMPLIESSSLKVRREYLLDSSRGIGWHYEPDGRQRAQAVIMLHLKNELGIALPRGTVRIYSDDGHAGMSQLLGEDSLRHTAKGEDIELNVGQAFDVSAKRTQTEQQTKSADRYVATWKVEVSNAKARDVEVRVIEPMPGDWKIEKSSHTHEKLDANRAAWTLKVPAGGKTTLEYRVSWK